MVPVEPVLPGQARPVSPADLALMRQLEELHLAYPFFRGETAVKVPAPAE